MHTNHTWAKMGRLKLINLRLNLANRLQTSQDLGATRHELPVRRNAIWLKQPTASPDNHIGVTHSEQVELVRCKSVRLTQATNFGGGRFNHS